MIFRLLLVLVSSFVAVESDPISEAAKNIINTFSSDSNALLPVNLDTDISLLEITKDGVQTTVTFGHLTIDNLFSFHINTEKSTHGQLVLTIKQLNIEVQCSVFRRSKRIKAFGSFEATLDNVDIKSDATGLDGKSKIILSNLKIEETEIRYGFVLNGMTRWQSVRNVLRRVLGTKFLREETFLDPIYDHVMPYVEKRALAVLSHCLEQAQPIILKNNGIIACDYV